MSFEDYTHKMSKANIAPDLSEIYIQRDLSHKAANLLNQSHV